MMKILVADDEYFEREILAQVVTDRFSHEVQLRMASNGRQVPPFGVRILFSWT